MIDPIKHISETNDVEYLTALDRFVDIDIANLSKQSDFEIKLKEDMFGKPIEELNQISLGLFNRMKDAIKKRLEYLKKDL